MVSAEAAWPLPWYLRNATAVGYFETAPADPAAWDVIVWDLQMGEPASQLLTDRLVEFHGLRPNMVLEVLIDQKIWDLLFPPTADT